MLDAKRDYDLDYRPASYWADLDFDTAVLSRIKGAERKAAIRALLDEGYIGIAFEPAAAESLDEADRTAQGRLHPLLMGGEFLPDLLPGEVEIARVSLASTTGDVTSVRARLAQDEIAYRVVDEYEDAGSVYYLQVTSSRQPLTMGN